MVNGVKHNVVLAVAVAILVGLVIGAVVASRRGITCEEWQRRYAAVQQQTGGGVLGSINEGPAAEALREVEEQRPERCETP